ncbi:MAG: GDCCVxC domain-containing (seleno)protein [Leptospirillia bacterium]
MQDDIVYESAISCLNCGRRDLVPMPSDACVRTHACSACGALRTVPPEGGCCVFCAYGTVPCPPVQARNGGNCCSG